MNEIDLLRRLDAAAAQLPSPPIDVTSAVMRDLRRPAAPPSDLRVWAWTAAGACALAATTLIAAIGAWEAVADPWQNLLTSLIPGMQ